MLRLVRYMSAAREQPLPAQQIDQLFTGTSPDRADAMAIAFAGRANAAPMNVESHSGEGITGDLMTKAW
jgi:hypothetical protein